jgi:hypothetical protein
VSGLCHCGLFHKVIRQVFIFSRKFPDLSISKAFPLGLITFPREGSSNSSNIWPRAFKPGHKPMGVEWEKRAEGLNLDYSVSLNSLILRTTSQSLTECSSPFQRPLGLQLIICCPSKGQFSSCANGEWDLGGTVCWTDGWQLCSALLLLPPSSCLSYALSPTVGAGRSRTTSQ